MSNYWMIVGTPGNLEISRALGWTVQGFKSRHGKKAAAMEPGDLLIYYVTHLQAFAAVAKVTSRFFESHEQVWHSDGKPDDYPWRVAIEPVAVLAPGRYIAAEPVAPRLAHVHKWPAANWTLAFQGNVHLLPREDGELLFSLITEAGGA